MEFVSTFNLLSAGFTILLQIILLVVFFAFLIKEKTIINFFVKNAFLFSFIVALMATVGSLIYSEFFGYEPCKLCWFQRIFLYPQVIILSIALFKQDKKIIPYIISLSAIGVFLAGYHYLLQNGLVSDVTCGVAGQSISCATRFVLEFGYITIPMMSLTIFVFILALMFLLVKQK